MPPANLHINRNMKRYREFTRVQLETWTTGRLGWLYMVLFESSCKSPEKSQLELVTSVLYERDDMSGKTITHRQLEFRLNSAIKHSSYLDQCMFRQMLLYYEKHVMG